jgi:hypothetical protein
MASKQGTDEFRQVMIRPIQPYGMGHDDSREDLIRGLHAWVSEVLAASCEVRRRWMCSG